MLHPKQMCGWAASTPTCAPAAAALQSHLCGLFAAYDEHQWEINAASPWHSTGKAPSKGKQSINCRGGGTQSMPEGAGDGEGRYRWGVGSLPHTHTHTHCSNATQRSLIHVNSWQRVSESTSPRIPRSEGRGGHACQRKPPPPIYVASRTGTNNQKHREEISPSTRSDAITWNL